MNWNREKAKNQPANQKLAALTHQTRYDMNRHFPHFPQMSAVYESSASRYRRLAHRRRVQCKWSRSHYDSSSTPPQRHRRKYANTNVSLFVGFHLPNFTQTHQEQLRRHINSSYCNSSYNTYASYAQVITFVLWINGQRDTLKTAARPQPHAPLEWTNLSYKLFTALYSCCDTISAAQFRENTLYSAVFQQLISFMSSSAGYPA